MTTDYSKWDRICADLSSDEEEKSVAPRVTKFDSPKSITIPTSNRNSFSGALHSNEKTSVSPESCFSSVCVPSPNPNPDGIGDEDQNIVQRDGYNWSQTRDEIKIVIPLSVGTRARDVTVSMNGALAGALLSVRQEIEGISKILLQGTLHYAIQPIDIQECWEVCTTSKGKQIEITFLKLSPVSGTVLWWSRLFSHEPPIDVSQIPARLRLQERQSKSMENSNSACASGLTFQESWQEAHRLFRERVKNRELPQIEVSASEDVEGNQIKTMLE